MSPSTKHAKVNGLNPKTLLSLNKVKAWIVVLIMFIAMFKRILLVVVVVKNQIVDIVKLFDHDGW
jgi:hypothetical protein